MSKIETRFVCQNCGWVAVKALGRCPQCGEWNSMVEEVIQSTPEERKKRGLNVATSKAMRLDEISAENNERWVLKNHEFSRVLGGGIVLAQLCS